MFDRHVVMLTALVMFLALTCSPFAQAGTASGVAGTWLGSWVKDGDALPVSMSFAAPGSHATSSFSSDALQVVDIPITQGSSKGNKVHFEIKGDQSTTIFDGAINGDHIAGTFVDADTRGTFELHRSRTSASAAVRNRDVTFRAGATTLAGTLLLPSTAGVHRAILFLQGSGAEGRWANRYLAEKFAEAGFVALIYDKRGVGQSTGDWQTAGFDALADDAAAGVRFLRAQPEVDATCVGIYGHSQGGTITPLVDSRMNGLAFVIASAAGGVDPATVETYSISNSIGLDKLDPSDRLDAQHYVHAIVNVAYRGADRASLNELATRFKDRSWFFAPPPPGASYWAISRQIASFDPATAWKHVQTPVLLVYGAHDERIPPAASIAAISAALAAGAHAKPTIKLYTDADHSFTLVDPNRTHGWPKHEPDYAATLIKWAKSVSPVSDPGQSRHP